MTDELRQLLRDVRARLEALGEDRDLCTGISEESDRLLGLWDTINALVGCDPGCDCCEPATQTDSKIIPFPILA
jgi:hypothetical protein